ncbi:dihydrolipoyl dehydrogenase family protein [Nocardioides agariphilus]|uniref:dihydrolipoyl dehydrogenase family protein n=1 Tax=Nocardioides agariphilus TaxID=433664 RepID=UPI003522761A
MTQQVPETPEVDCDVVVLGLGPGGEHAAIKLARAGLDVIGIEDRLVGGECPYYGCVPSKMMIAAAHVIADVHKVARFGGTAHVDPDWGAVARRIRDEATDDWDDAVAVKRLEDNGARFVRGRGVLVGPGQVRVGGTTYAARKGVVLNTGTDPAAPPVEGLAGTPYWTNRDAVALTELPRSLVVLGGGPIGCEFAQVFARYGVEVTVVEVADRLIAVEEPEASALLEKAFADEGITVLTGASVSSVRHDESGFTLRVDQRDVVADKLLVAAGRQANLDHIGLDTVGLGEGLKVVETDERMRAGDKLWAVGDITGKGAYTHVSMYQAAVAVRDILGEDGPWADYRAVPHVTFTAPEIASVGLSEKAARDQGIDVAIGTGDLGARGWLAKEEGMIKLVADRERGVLVGGCVVSEAGGEIASFLEVAVHAEIPVATLLTMHFAYPTYHRALEHALKDIDLGSS